MQNYQDLLDDLARVQGRIASAVAGLRPDHLRFKPAPAEFSILENVAHIRDLELAATTQRIKRAVTETNPGLENFDGAAVAAAADYNAEDFDEAFDAFCFTRAENVAGLRARAPHVFERPVVLGDQPMTLFGVLELLRAHDEEHVAAIEAIGSQLRGERTR